MGSGSPFPSPGELPNPGMEPGSPALQVDSLPSETPAKPIASTNVNHFLLSKLCPFQHYGLSRVRRCHPAGSCRCVWSIQLRNKLSSPFRQTRIQWMGQTLISSVSSWGLSSQGQLSHVGKHTVVESVLRVYVPCSRAKAEISPEMTGATR